MSDFEGIQEEIARRARIIDDPSYDPGPKLNRMIPLALTSRGLCYWSCP